MSGALTLRFSTQAQLDIQRMTRQLSDLQRQVASGQKANDLRGFGDGASRLLNAQSLKASAEARGSAVSQLEARFGVQASALNAVSTATAGLATSIRDAISANDGRAIEVDLTLAFSSAIAALNESWNGQPLFAGERMGSVPVKITSLDDLVAATGPDDIYDEAERHQTIDLGAGPPIALANKASELSQAMFDTMKQLKQLIDSSGGLGAPMSGEEITELQEIADQLDDVSATFTNAEGRAGQLETRFASERSRMKDRSNLLVMEIGDQADADVAMISIQISSLLAQYEATAKTFSDLSKLTLIDYL